ncbi:hypothetical protein KIPB_012024, partial [Kipferlia bialata]
LAVPHPEGVSVSEADDTHYLTDSCLVASVVDYIQHSMLPAASESDDDATDIVLVMPVSYTAYQQESLMDAVRAVPGVGSVTSIPSVLAVTLNYVTSRANEIPLVNAKGEREPEELEEGQTPKPSNFLVIDAGSSTISAGLVSAERRVLDTDKKDKK